MTPQLDTERFSFYACSMISFLESRVDTYVENLEPFFRCDDKPLQWLNEVWLREESEHGRLMRSYVEDTWPHFDWEAGYSKFSTLYTPACSTEKLRSSVSLEALARCVTETEASMIYRCIGNYVQDPKLRSLLRQMSADEVNHYRHFKDIHRIHEATENNHFIKKARTLVARSELVRDEDLAMAYEPLNSSWRRPPCFELWSYREFLTHAAKVMKHHFPFEGARRMMFHPIATGSLFNRLTLNLLAKVVAGQFLRYSLPE